MHTFWITQITITRHSIPLTYTMELLKPVHSFVLSINIMEYFYSFTFLLAKFSFQGDTNEYTASKLFSTLHFMGSLT